VLRTRPPDAPFRLVVRGRRGPPLRGLRPSGPDPPAGPTGGGGRCASIRASLELKETTREGSDRTRTAGGPGASVPGPTRGGSGGAEGSGGEQHGAPASVPGHVASRSRLGPIGRRRPFRGRPRPHRRAERGRNI